MKHKRVVALNLLNYRVVANGVLMKTFKNKITIKKKPIKARKSVGTKLKICVEFCLRILWKIVPSRNYIRSDVSYFRRQSAYFYIFTTKAKINNNRQLTDWNVVCNRYVVKRKPIKVILAETKFNFISVFFFIIWIHYVTNL